jgi:hypothetical protein
MDRKRVLEIELIFRRTACGRWRQKVNNVNVARGNVVRLAIGSAKGCADAQRQQGGQKQEGASGHEDEGKRDRPRRIETSVMPGRGNREIR